MGRRTQGRELCLQALYQLDLLGVGFDALERDRFLEAYAEDDEVRAFAATLVRGVMRKRDALDAAIAETAENWRLERMPVVDRNILRIGGFELLYAADRVPPKVAINEAVELAKKFSTKEAGGFVNGILDKLSTHARTPSGPAPPAPPPEEDRP